MFNMKFNQISKYGIFSYYTMLKLLKNLRTTGANMIVSSLKILFSTFPILLNHKLLILKLALFWSNNKDLIASLQKADIERKVDLGVILGQKILEFKKENNAKFDEIFEVIDEIIAKYKSDEEFRQQIKDIIKKI